MRCLRHTRAVHIRNIGSSKARRLISNMEWAGHWAALEALLEGAPLRSLAGAPGLAPLLAAGGRLAALVRLLERAADVPPADTRALLRLLLAGGSADSRDAHEVRGRLWGAMTMMKSML